MLNWVFEGSINGIDWFIIDKRVHFIKDNEEFNVKLDKERKLLMIRGVTTTWGID